MLNPGSVAVLVTSSAIYRDTQHHNRSELPRMYSLTPGKYSFCIDIIETKIYIKGCATKKKRAGGGGGGKGAGLYALVCAAF